jgi:hypothetical protein
MKAASLLLANASPLGCIAFVAWVLAQQTLGNGTDIVSIIFALLHLLLALGRHQQLHHQ